MGVEETADMDERYHLIMHEQRTLSVVSGVVKDHSRILNEHSRMLEDHGRLLQEHGRDLNDIKHRLTQG
jgi:hypothetical protein